MGEEAAKLMRAHMFNASNALEGYARLFTSPDVQG
jgi:hypothetical protein